MASSRALPCVLRGTGGGNGQRQVEATKKVLKQAAAIEIDMLAVVLVPAEFNELARLKTERLALMDCRQNLLRQLSEELQGQARGIVRWWLKAMELCTALYDIKSWINAPVAKLDAYGDAGRWGVRQQAVGVVRGGA